MCSVLVMQTRCILLRFLSKVDVVSILLQSKTFYGNIKHTRDPDFLTRASLTPPRKVLSPETTRKSNFSSRMPITSAVHLAANWILKTWIGAKLTCSCRLQIEIKTSSRNATSFRQSAGIRQELAPLNSAEIFIGGTRNFWRGGGVTSYDYFWTSFSLERGATLKMAKMTFFKVKFSDQRGVATPTTLP